MPSYTYFDGSKPRAKQVQEYAKSNWGVPIYNLLSQLDSNVLYRYDNFPKVQRQVSPTRYMAERNREARQQTVRLEDSCGSGSGVIVAKQGTTYYVLTAKHVIETPPKSIDCKPGLHQKIELTTHDQERYQIQPSEIELAKGLDLAIVKFTSNADYPVARLSSVKPRPDDVVLVGGYPNRYKINSPLWQWQLNPGTSFGQDLGIKTTRNEHSFTEGYNLVYTNITYGGMSGGPVFDTDGRVVGLHGRSEEGDSPPQLMLGNSLGISIKSFIASANQLKVNRQLLQISKDVPRYLNAAELKSVADVEHNLPQPDGESSGKQWLQYGGQLNRIKQYSKAIAAFDRAIAIDPKIYKLPGIYGKARAYDRLGFIDRKSATNFRGLKGDFKLDNYQRALTLYSEAIANIPPARSQQEYYFLWKKRAAILFVMTKFDEALQANQQAINLNPNDRVLYIDRAVYYKIKGVAMRLSTGDFNANSIENFKQAISIYDRLIPTQPDASVYDARGVAKTFMVSELDGVYDRAKAVPIYQSALADYDMALKLDPEFTDAYYDRAISKQQLKDFKGALADLNSAISYAPRNDRYYSQRASIKEDLRDFNSAISDYNTAISLNPNNSDNYLGRGLVKFKQQDYQGAIADYTQSIAIDPKNYLVYSARSAVKNLLKDYQGALADAEQAIAISPKYTLAYSNRGDAKLGLKDYQGAISDYTQAISLYPKNVYVYISRGNAKKELKDYQGALADYTQAIAINPKNADGYNMRGILKSNLKDYQGAIADYTQSLAIDPKNDNTYSMRGTIKIKLKDYPGAISDYTQAIAIKPKDDSNYSIRGIAKKELKDYRGAIADFTQSIALNPKNYLVYNGRGDAKFQLKDYQGTIADYTASIAINPKQDNAYNGRGDAKLRLKDYQGAIADYTQSISINPKNDHVYNIRGAAKAELGDYQGAIADTDRSIAINPKNDNAYNSRGWYKFLVNNNPGAIEDWELAMKLNPNNAYAYANRGLYQVILGNDRSALADIDRSIQLNPKLADAYAIRGLIRDNSGNKAGAMSDYKEALKLEPKIIESFTKDAKQLQRSNHRAAYQKYQQLIGGLTAQK